MRLIWICSLAAFLMLGPHAAVAQDYPSRVIRAVLPFSPGGLGDTVFRAIGQGLTKSLGQGIAVENRPGAGTQIGAQACATAPADGYTFCMLPVDALSYQPFITKNLPYDPDRSFEPITAVFYLTEVIVVSPATKVNSIDELIALSKAKPNTLNYATTATSSILFFENFKHETGADLTKIVYKGGADAVNAMLGGEAQAGLLRARQCRRPDPGRLAQGVGGRRCAALPAAARRADARGSRLQGSAEPGVVRLVRTGGDAEADRRAAADRGRARRARAGILAQVHDWARPGAHSQLAEEFGRFLREDRARAELLVKRSGLQMQ